MNIDWNEVYLRNRSVTHRDYLALTTDNLNYILNKQSGEGKTALDIGCGTGQVCRDLFHRGFDVIGVDLSGEAIKTAKSSTKYLNKGVAFLQCDVETEKLSLETMDLIVCKDTYTFIKDKKAFVDNVLSVMREDSLLVIISLAPQYAPEKKRHITVEKREVIKDLQPYFFEISHELRGRDDYYFCKP